MRTGLLVMKCTVAVAALAMVTSAMAQGQGRRNGRGGGFGGGLQPLTVLQNDKVQADLVLSEDQKSQVAKLVEENMGQRGQRGAGGAGAGGAGGGAAAAQQRRDDEMKKINDVLLAPQQDRFAQIMMQLEGTSQALADTKVADKLGLTADQKTKLDTLRTDYMQKLRDLFMGVLDPTEMTKLRTEQNDKAKDLLTADQKTQYDKMLGTKIDIDPATLRGGRGNRGRRGRGATPNA